MKPPTIYGRREAVPICSYCLEKGQTHRLLWIEESVDYECSFCQLHSVPDRHHPVNFTGPYFGIPPKLAAALKQWRSFQDTMALRFADDTALRAAIDAEPLLNQGKEP